MTKPLYEAPAVAVSTPGSRYAAENYDDDCESHKQPGRRRAFSHYGAWEEEELDSPFDPRECLERVKLVAVHEEILEFAIQPATEHLGYGRCTGRP